MIINDYFITNSIKNIIQNTLLIKFLLVILYFLYIKFNLIIRLFCLALIIFIFICLIWVGVWYFILRKIKFFRDLIK
jgi:hypothetical protein